MRRSERIHAIEATRLLNEFIGDLVTGSRVTELLDVLSQQAKVDEETQIAMRRMCMWHIIVTLSKWQEVYDSYLEIFPDDVRKVSRDLRKEMKRRGIRDFRNIVVGHILDKKTKKPISKDEIDKKLDKLFDGSDKKFLLWVNNPAQNIFPTTVVSIVERIRDGLMQQHSITDAELFPWNH
jgi:succinate dehydrogenase flavin-adding protein (antitoxin of CptAB toxin-antitoxin module)